MTNPQYNTTNPSVTLTIKAIDLEAVVRVMLKGAKPAKIRNRLAWFYDYGGVPRPAERSGAASNVVTLSEHRDKRHIEREYGPAALALTHETMRQRTDLMTRFALRLEAELEVSERVEARKTRK